MSHDLHTIGRPEVLRCGFHPFHAPSGENQVVMRTRRKLPGGLIADGGMAARDESCWHNNLLELTMSARALAGVRYTPIVDSETPHTWLRSRSSSKL